MLSAGMIVANLLAPAAPAMHAARMQELIVNIIENAIIALCAGLAVVLLEKLGALKQGALSRVLGRQREELTAKTHEKLHGQVERLTAEIESMRTEGDAGQAGVSAISLIETRSNELKKALRQILRSLDQADGDPVDAQGAARQASF